jgi:hypothetical protein
LQSSISIGANSCTYNTCDIAIGFATDACGGSSIAIGNTAQVDINKYHGIAIGCGTSVTAEFAGAIGSTSSATANGAYALGQGVIAATANTVSVKALETQTDSTPTAGGIIMSDAGGTNRRLNIDAAGGLQIDSTPVGGGGGAAGLVSGTGTASMKSAASLTTLAADAYMPTSIAIGNGACTGTTVATPVNVQREGIAIGNGACALTDTDYSFTDNIAGVAIGLDACARTGGSTPAVAIGQLSFATDGGVGIGRLSNAGGDNSIAIGNVTQTTGTNSVSMSSNSCATAYGAIAIGHGVCATAGGFYQGSTAIGNNSRATAVCSVALGVGVIASRADTVAGNQFEAKTVGKGVIVTSPDGLTTLGIGIDNTGAIVTYTP